MTGLVGVASGSAGSYWEPDGGLPLPRATRPSCRIWLSERLFETDSIEYQDYQGNKLVINSNLYSNDDYGHLEWYLKQKKEYVLIERLATRGQPSDFSDRLVVGAPDELTPNSKLVALASAAKSPSETA